MATRRHRGNDVHVGINSVWNIPELLWGDDRIDYIEPAPIDASLWHEPKPVDWGSVRGNPFAPREPRPHPFTDYKRPRSNWKVHQPQIDGADAAAAHAEHFRRMKMGHQPTIPANPYPPRKVSSPRLNAQRMADEVKRELERNFREAYQEAWEKADDPRAQSGWLRYKHSGNQEFVSAVNKRLSQWSDEAPPNVHVEQLSDTDWQIRWDSIRDSQEWRNTAHRAMFYPGAGWPDLRQGLTESTIVAVDGLSATQMQEIRTSILDDPFVSHLLRKE